MTVKRHTPPGRKLGEVLAERPISNGVSSTKRNSWGQQTVHHEGGGSGGMPTKFNVDPNHQR